MSFGVQWSVFQIKFRTFNADPSLHGYGRASCAFDFFIVLCRKFRRDVQTSNPGIWVMFRLAAQLMAYGCPLRQRDISVLPDSLVEIRIFSLLNLSLERVSPSDSAMVSV